MTEGDKRELERLIRARLDDAAAEQAAASVLREDVTLDPQSVGRLSRMDALQRQAMAQATAARRLHQIERLHGALRRIGDPEFGACAECGDDIPLDRLRIEPTLTRCADCIRSA